MHDLIIALPLPSEIINHFIIPFVPFVDLTEKIIQLQLKRIRLWSSINKYLKIEDPLLKKDILFHFTDFESLQYVYDESELFLYMSFETSDLNLIDDYFAILF